MTLEPQWYRAIEIETDLVKRQVVRSNYLKLLKISPELLFLSVIIRNLFQIYNANCIKRFNADFRDNVKKTAIKMAFKHQFTIQQLSVLYL